MPPKADTIIELEQRFWQSMVERDAETATTMIADECLLTGPRGSIKIDPEKYAEMTRDGEWRLDTFKLSDVDVVFPAENVAVIVYEVHQEGEMAGKAMDLRCTDSSTWVYEDGAWKCALHTETCIADGKRTRQ